MQCLFAFPLLCFSYQPRSTETSCDLCELFAVCSLLPLGLCGGFFGGEGVGVTNSMNNQSLGKGILLPSLSFAKGNCVDLITAL